MCSRQVIMPEQINPRHFQMTMLVTRAPYPPECEHTLFFGDANESIKHIPVPSSLVHWKSGQTQYRQQQMTSLLLIENEDKLVYRCHDNDNDVVGVVWVHVHLPSDVILIREISAGVPTTAPQDPATKPVGRTGHKQELHTYSVMFLSCYPSTSSSICLEVFHQV